MQQRTEYKVSLLIYKCLHQAAPLYLTELCVPVSAIQRRHGLRSAVRGDLEVPRCNLAKYRQRSFYVSGPSLWNSLPLTVRDSSLTLTQFCTRLKTFLFTRAYTGHHHSASVTASAVRIAARTYIFLLTYLLTYLLFCSAELSRTNADPHTAPQFAFSSSISSSGPSATRPT